MLGGKKDSSGLSTVLDRTTSNSPDSVNAALLLGHLDSLIDLTVLRVGLEAVVAKIVKNALQTT